MKSRFRPILPLLVAALAIGTLVTACEPDDGADAPSAPPTTEATADAGVAASPTLAEAPLEMPEVVVAAKDLEGGKYAYEGPAEVPAGMTRLTMTNEGQALHQVALIQLAEGKAFEDFAAYAQTATEGTPMPDWMTAAGGPNAAVPGMSSSAFVDLQPGYYVMMCNIPDDKGVPHFQNGMIRPLRVGEATAASAAEPAADVTIQGEDFAFGVESSIPAGSHVLRFTNGGKQPHEATLVKLNEGATAQEVAAAFAPGGSGQPPAVPVGGIVGLAPGASQSFPIDLTVGRYALLCFFTDPATGKMHTQLGMTDEFDVQ